MPDLNEVDKLFPMMSVPTKRLRRPDDESNKVDEEAQRRFPPGEITFEIGTTGEEVLSSLLSIGNNNGVVSHEDEEKKLSQTMEGVESSSSDEEKEDEEEYCQDYFSGSGCDNNNNNNGEIEEDDDDEEHMITKPAHEERGGSSIKKSSTTSVTITRLIQSLENHASGGKKERPQAYCECSKCSLRTKSSAAAAAATTAVVVYHDKQPADTLESISLQYNVTPEMIRRANNNFLGDDLVCAPNRLVIPITTSTTTTTTTTTAVNTATATTPNQNHHETMTAKEQHGLTNHEKVEYLQSQLSKLSLSRDDAVSFLKLNDWNLSRSIRNVNIQKRFLSPRGSK
jgi:LysM repeat protein